MDNQHLLMPMSGGRATLALWRRVDARVQRRHHMTTFFFIFGIVSVVAALLAIDWFMAGRSGRRSPSSARDAYTRNPNPGYAEITQVDTHIEHKTHP
jgi:hypothetical protein